MVSYSRTPFTLSLYSSPLPETLEESFVGPALRLSFLGDLFINILYLCFVDIQGCALENFTIELCNNAVKERLGHCWVLVDLNYCYLILWTNFELLGMRICRRWIFFNLFLLA
jgi:hypothetical protein